MLTNYSKYKNRKTQATERNEAVPKYIEELQETKTKAIEIREKMPWVTEQEQSDLIEKVAETRDWLDGKIEEQSGLSPDEDPAFTVDDVESKMKKLNSLAKKVFSKKKPKEPKKKKEEKIEDEEKDKENDKEDSKQDGEEEVINLDDEEFDDEDEAKSEL